MNVHYYQAQINLLETIIDNLCQHADLPDVAANMGVGQSGIDALKVRLLNLKEDAASIHADMSALAETSSDPVVAAAGRKGED